MKYNTQINLLRTNNAVGTAIGTYFLGPKFIALGSAIDQGIKAKNPALMTAEKSYQYNPVTESDRFNTGLDKQNKVSYTPIEGDYGGFGKGLDTAFTIGGTIGSMSNYKGYKGGTQGVTTEPSTNYTNDLNGSVDKTQNSLNIFSGLFDKSKKQNDGFAQKDYFKQDETLTTNKSNPIMSYEANQYNGDKPLSYEGEQNIINQFKNINNQPVY